MKKILLFGLAVIQFGLFADSDIVKKTNSKPVLAAIVELSPFANVTAKANILGVTMNNPIVPTLLLTASQQALYNEYGQMRTDMPMYCAVYVQSPAYKVAATNDMEVDVEEIAQTVVVYPLAEKPNTYALRCPGARKNPDGTLYVPATGNRKENYTVAYSRNQKVAAFGQNAELAKLALKDCEKFYMDEKRKENEPLIKVSIEKTGLSFLAAMHESNLIQKANEDKSLPKAAMDRKAKLVREKFESYENMTLFADIASTGLSIQARAEKKNGAKVPSYAGVKMPAGMLDAVSSNAKIFYALNMLSSAGMEGEDFREYLTEMVPFLMNCLKDSKNKNVAAFAKKMSPHIETFAKELPLPSKNDYRMGWIAMDSSSAPYIAEIETSGNPDKYYNCGITVLDALEKTATEIWPKNKVFTKGAEAGTYLLDWDAIVDINGIEEGKPAPKELAVAKKKIKTIIGDSKGAFFYKKTANGVTRLFGNARSKMPSAKGDAEARLAAALPEILKDRPTSVIYLMPYSFIRDVALPIVAKSASKAERDRYNMMIQAMVPAMPNSAIALASWVDDNGSERALLRITANELKSLGVIFNTFTASMLSNQGGEAEEE